MTDHITARILQPGETVLWQGSPEHDSWLTRQARLLYTALSLLMAAFALMIRLVSGSWLAATAVLVMLASLLLMALLDTMQRTQQSLQDTFYFVTDRRVLVCQYRKEDGLLVVRQKKNLADVTRLRVVRECGGLASIYFLPMNRFPWSWHAFLYIADAEAVAALIRSQPGYGGKKGAC